MFNLLLTLTIIFLSITGCQTNQAPNPKNSPPHQKNQQELREWKVSGKLAYKEKTRGENVNFHWEQDKQKFHITLSAPFSSQKAHIYGTRSGTSVFVDHLGRKSKAHSPEKLMQQHLGWQIPIEHLFFWAQGKPTPDLKVDAKKLDEFGRYRLIKQDGWEITYPSYTDYLPYKLVLKRNNTRITVVFKKWAYIK